MIIHSFIMSIIELSVIPDSLISEDAVFPKKHTSWVWKHFKISPSNPLKAYCIKSNCIKPVEKRENGNTSNLMRHLRSQHNILEAKKEESDTANTSIVEALRKQKEKYGNEKYSVTQSSIITQQLAIMIIENYLPISIVDSDTFREFINSVASGKYLPPGRTAMTANIDSMCENMVDILMNDIQHQAISVTTDSATLKNSRAYISVTAHYITKEFRLRDVVLALILAEESQNGDFINDMLTKVIKQFNNSGKAFAAVTDNGSNFVRGVEINCTFEEQLRCAVHTIQLSVKDVAKNHKEFGNLIAKAKRLVGKFNISNNLKAELRNIQMKLEKEGEAQKRKHVYVVVQDVATRFNTICLMFTRLLELQKAIQELIYKDDKHVFDDAELTQKEWKEMEEYNTVLCIIKDVCDQLEGSKYPTISLLFALSLLLNKTLIDITANLELEFPKKMCSEVQSNFSNRYNSDLNKWLLDIALTLDPRFKNLEIPGYDSSNAKSKLQMVYNGFNWGRLSGEPSTNIDAQPNVVQVEEYQPPKKKFIVSLAVLKKTPIPATPVVNEVDRYFAIPGIDVKENPLKWWNLNSNSFPVLAKMARVYLAIPASSAPSERSFSSAGLTLSQRRRHLHADRVSRLVFMKHNLHLYHELTKEKTFN